LKNGWVMAIAAGLAAGCGREAPPEIHEYVPIRVAKAAPQTQEAEPEEMVEAAAVEAPAAPAPVRQEVMVAAAPAAATEVAKAPAAPAVAQAPTVLGTWRVVEMSQHGEAMPMPAGMSMQLTFEEGGTLTTVMSMPGMPEPQRQQGTYSVSGDQITLIIGGDAKTGGLRFEGDSRMIVDAGDTRIVLTRA
jgi:hypothetical protein